MNRNLKLEDSDVDKWSDILKKETFETFSFPLSYEESRAISLFYRVKILKHTDRFKFSDDEEVLVSSVKTKMDKIMKKNPRKNGYFVRLGSRSPKDSCLYGDGIKCSENMKKILKKKFRKFFIEENGKPNDELDSVTNRTFTFLMESCCESLRVYNCEEAMEMILHSERVYTDLLLVLDFKELYMKNPMKIIIRSWMDDIPYRNEFRGFVYNSKMTALSQYDNYCYYSELKKEKDVLKIKIKKYFDEKIENLLTKNGFKNYVIDIGVRTNGECIVIELNPYDLDEQHQKGTGSGNFSWIRDEKLLKEGPFTFRITEKPPFNKIEEHIDPTWLEIIEIVKREILNEKTERKRKGCCIM